jgi:phosphate transport system protein
LAGTDFVLPAILTDMSATARKMLQEALNALVDLDPVAAMRVCETDDEVDRAHAEVASELYQTMRDDPKQIGPGIHCLTVARHLERIADHATNIAEDVVYLVRGDIARHRHVELPDDKETIPTN